MHVLQFLSSSAYAGAEAMAAELARQLRLAGARVDIAILDNAGRGNSDIFDIVGEHADAVYRLPCARQFDFETVRALRSRVADRNIDIVHSHKYKTTFHAAFARRGGRFGLVTTYHNWILTSGPLRLYAAVDKRIARFNDVSVGVSGPVVEELRRFVAAGRLRQIDNGVDTEVFRPSHDRLALRVQLGLPIDKPVIGFVGRLSIEKCIPVLLSALLEPNLARVHALIVGDGEQRARLEAEARRPELAGRVHFVGHRRDTAACYGTMDLLVLPSSVEAFPMVLLEAMACGTPVVATRVGEVPRMVTEGKTGTLFDVGDALALANAVSTMLTQGDKLAAMGRSGRASVQQRFSAAAMASSYLNAYEHALGG